MDRPSETSRVSFHTNKFEKLVYLVGFTVEIYYDARPYERQKRDEESNSGNTRPQRRNSICILYC